MSENNLIECTYGHHMVDREKGFSISGLNGKYYSICRKCKAEKQKQYRQKYNDEYNEKHKMYQRQWILNKNEIKIIT